MYIWESALVRHGLGRPPSEAVSQDQGERFCVDCGDPIPKARLRARPGAFRCVACQGEHEARRDAVST